MTKIFECWIDSTVVEVTADSEDDARKKGLDLFRKPGTLEVVDVSVFESVRQYRLKPRTEPMDVDYMEAESLILRHDREESKILIFGHDDDQTMKLSYLEAQALRDWLNRAFPVA